MIRFIIRHDWQPGDGNVLSNFITVDGDVAELERLLSSGGSGESNYERCTLIGAEVIAETAP